MNPFSQILVSSSALKFDKNQNVKLPLAELKDGQIVDAKVLRALSAREAELSLLGQRVTVKTHVPFKEGEVVSLQVQGKGDEKTLKFLSKSAPLPNSSPKAGKLEIRQDFKLPLAGLKSGQTVDAHVARIVSGKEAELVILGHRVSVRTPIPLKEGDTVSLTVSGTGNEKVLTVATESRQPVLSQPAVLSSRLALVSGERSGPWQNLLDLISEAGLHHAKPGDRDISPHIRKLAQMIRSISLKSEIPDAGGLKSMVKNSGLFFENRVAKNLSAKIPEGSPAMDSIIRTDLKAVAAKLSGQLSGQISGDAPEAVRLISSFIDGLENHQLLNKQTIEDFGRMLLPLPVLDDGVFSFGQLLIDLGREGGSRGRESGRVVKVAFILEMSELGDVRADVSILKKALSGVFCVGNRRAYELFREAFPGLAGKLGAHGYTVHRLDCIVVDPDELASASLAEELAHPDEAGLNIVI